jgi:hypothetical protein
MLASGRRVFAHSRKKSEGNGKEVTPAATRTNPEQKLEQGMSDGIVRELLSLPTLLDSPK